MRLFIEGTTNPMWAVHRLYDLVSDVEGHLNRMSVVPSRHDDAETLAEYIAGRVAAPTVSKAYCLPSTWWLNKDSILERVTRMTHTISEINTWVVFVLPKE